MAGTRGFVTAEATIGCPQFESSDPAIAEMGGLAGEITVTVQ